MELALQGVIDDFGFDVTLEMTSCQRMQLLDVCKLMAKDTALNLLASDAGVHEARPLSLTWAELLLKELQQ